VADRRDPGVLGTGIARRQRLAWPVRHWRRTGAPVPHRPRAARLPDGRALRATLWFPAKGEGIVVTNGVKLEGKCLCGAVQVRIAPPGPHVGACHCGMCRRWGGGPALSLRLVPDPEIEGAEHVVRYPSSDWAERGFCRTCGTHLF